MKNIKIRKAVVGDELELATMHIQSWQEAYKGLLPQRYLDRLPLELDERTDNWKKTLESENRWTLIAEDNQKIIGFILFGTARAANKTEYIELGALYLLASYKGHRIGFQLLYAGFKLMKELGYKKAYCWVLESNPSIHFYEKSGAKFSGEIRNDEVDGEIFIDRIYQWENLELEYRVYGT